MFEIKNSRRFKASACTGYTPRNEAFNIKSMSGIHANNSGDFAIRTLPNAGITGIGGNEAGALLLQWRLSRTACPALRRPDAALYQDERWRKVTIYKTIVSF